MATGQDNRYQGWTNYETWAVKLWMDNEEPSYLHWKETTRAIIAAAKEAS